MVAAGHKICYTVLRLMCRGLLRGPAVWNEPEGKGENIMLHTEYRLHRVAFPLFRAGALFPKIRGTAVLIAAMPLFLGEHL